MKPLCPVGSELRELASNADRIFKSGLLEFFSNPKREDEERQQIEILGVQQREADEAFNRHRKQCLVCTEAVFRLEGQRRSVALG